MMEDNAASQARLIGGLIIAAALGALLLMMHHPTSIAGPDDGLLLRDWSNAGVHGGMIACVLVLIFAFAVVARRLGEEHLAVRAGAMSLTGGMSALALAALINGFIVGAVRSALPDASAVTVQLVTLTAMNQGLALLGMVLVSAATALWGIRLVRLDGLSKVAGCLGIAMALAAGWWLLAGARFGLYPATYSLIAFAAWSLIVATQLIRGRL